MIDPALLDGVATHLADLDLGATVVVAVSGGGDSVALLHLVRAARPDLSVVVGHVRHGLRDDAADADAAIRNAVVLGVRAEVLTVTVGAGAGPEDAARTARYDALAGLCRAVRAADVLVGHTADDQAETMLLRLARGTGPDGLLGMDHVGPVPGHRDLRVRRPLLDLRRDDVRRVAATHPTVEDPTNDDADQRRARSRHSALPALGALRPDEGDAVPALLRLRSLLADELALRDALVGPPRWWGPMVALVDAQAPPRGPTSRDVPPPRVQVGLDATARRVLDRRALRVAVAQLVDGAALSHERTDALVDMASGASADVGAGIRATRDATGWTLCAHGDPLAPRPLHAGASVVISELDLLVRADGAERPSPTRHGAEARATGPTGHRTPVDLAPATLVLSGANLPLSISSRGPDGDREARPVLQGRYAAGVRHLVPLIHDSAGRLLSVGRWRVAAPGPREVTVTVDLVPAPAGRV